MRPYPIVQAANCAADPAAKRAAVQYISAETRRFFGNKISHIDTFDIMTNRSSPHILIVV